MAILTMAQTSTTPRSRSFMYNTYFNSIPDNPLDKASKPKTQFRKPSELENIIHG